MKFIKTKIQGIIIIEPDLFGDDRGYFYEVYHQAKFKEAGIDVEFIQDNQSSSAQGTLRGLHYQTAPMGQAKLVRCVQGEIFDVGVDIRKDSPTYGQWVGAILSSENKKQLFVPPEFAHGFYVLSETAEVHYKCSNLWSPEHERSIRWDDPTINIDWPLINGLEIKLSEKDKQAPLF